MREALLHYGLFVSLGIFGVAGWTSIAVFSDGAIPGGQAASASVTVPLAIACALLAVHCLFSLASKGADT